MQIAPPQKGRSFRYGIISEDFVAMRLPAVGLVVISPQTIEFSTNEARQYYKKKLWNTKLSQEAY